MSKPAYDPTTGKPIYSPDTGKPALDCGGATTPPAWRLEPCYNLNCSYSCDEGGPEAFDVTVSGVSGCSCINTSGASLGDFEISSGVNGTHRVPRVSGCNYFLADIGELTFNVYGETDCGGEVVESRGPYQLDISVRFGQSTKLIVEIYWQGGTNGVYAYGVLLHRHGIDNGYLDKPEDECIDLPDYAITDEMCTRDLVHIGDFTYFGYAVSEGPVNLSFEPVKDTSGRCPGGEIYYTDTDMSEWEGEYIEFVGTGTGEPISGICYRVLANSADESADGDVDTGKIDGCWTTRAKCCADDTEDC